MVNERVGGAEGGAEPTAGRQAEGGTPGLGAAAAAPGAHRTGDGTGAEEALPGLAAVRARLRASLVPVSSAVHGAVRAHATGLALIAPDALAGRHPTASPHAGPVASRFADLELLLGASTSPSAS